MGVSAFTAALTSAEMAELASVFDFDDGTDRLHQTIQYLHERSKYEESRWLAALGKSRMPVTLIWGEKDPVAAAWVILPSMRSPRRSRMSPTSMLVPAERRRWSIAVCRVRRISSWSRSCRPTPAAGWFSQRCRLWFRSSRSLPYSSCGMTVVVEPTRDHGRVWVPGSGVPRSGYRTARTGYRTSATASARN